MVQKIIELLQSQPQNVMVCPADERGAELQPHVKSLVLSVKPISNPREALRSPLSNDSLTQLVLRCKETATDMEDRFRRRHAMREVKNDLDSLKLLSEALDLPAVTTSYHGICKLLADHVTEACERARDCFARGDFVETKSNLSRMDGFEGMEQHYETVCPDLRARVYVPLFVEVNDVVRSCFAEASDLGASLETVKSRLDDLRGIDQVLKCLLDQKVRDHYRRAVEAVENRFNTAYQGAKQMISTDQLSLELDQLLTNMQLMPHFQEHFRDAHYYQDCIESLNSKLNAAHNVVAQHLTDQIQAETAQEITAGMAMLSAACQLRDCHAPDAQEQSADCIRLFDSKCNSLFACVDMGMSNQDYRDVGDSLGQLSLLLKVKGDDEFEQRYKDKIHDIQARLENAVSSIRCILGEEIPRDQDYSSAVAQVHKFAEALEHLSKYLPSSAANQFDHEKHHIISEIDALHKHVFECATRSMGLGVGSENREDPKELAKLLIQIEFMLRTRLDFENELYSFRDEFRTSLLRFFSDKFDWCDNQTRRVDRLEVVDEIKLHLALLKTYSDEFTKLSERGVALSEFFSAESSIYEPECYQSPAASSAPDMSEARTVRRQSRTAVLPVSGGMCLFRGILDLASDGVESGPAQDGNASCVGMKETPYTNGSIESVSAIEDLTRLLKTALTLSVDNLRSRAMEVEETCLEQLQMLKFEDAKHLFALLSSFGRLEFLVEDTLTDRYKSAVSNAKNMLSNISDTFDSLIRSEEMEKALTAVNTVRSMLVLKDDVPAVEEVYRRLNSEFQQKTSNFNATMNELLECKNFQKMTKLLRGHGQLENAVPAARHEFHSAHQQLAEFFKLRYESGWSIIQSIVPTKRLADHKLSELREVIKDFTDARPVFEIFSAHSQFTEWEETLIRTLRSRAAAIAQHADTCTRNLDFRGYDGCVSYLELLQVFSLVAEDISQNIMEMDTKMQRRIEGLEVELVAAIDRNEPRVMDKIFNGLKRGLDMNNIAGKKLDEEYEQLQTVLEHHLKDLCTAIQRSLDNYEIREAHENLEKFRSLLVSEAVKGTQYNGDRLSKFVSEMDEIKQDILTPRLLTEDPEKISRCLEGFKEVDSR